MTFLTAKLNDIKYDPSENGKGYSDFPKVNLLGHISRYVQDRSC